MKKIIRISGLFQAIIIAGMLISSCGNDNTHKTTTATTTEEPATTDKDAAEDQNDAKFKKDAEDNAQYVLDAWHDGAMEIEKSKVAETRATNKQVKALAASMVADHSKLNDKLRDLAAKKQITLPSGLNDDELKDARDDNDGKKGADYDKAYVSDLVDDHEKCLKKFEKAAEESTDPDIKAAFSDALPQLRHHLEMAMSLKDQLKK